MKCVSAIVIINFSRSVFPKSRGSTSPLTPLARDLQRNYQFCTNFEKVVPSGGGGGWGGGARMLVQKRSGNLLMTYRRRQ